MALVIVREGDPSEGADPETVFCCTRSSDVKILG